MNIKFIITIAVALLVSTACSGQAKQEKNMEAKGKPLPAVQGCLGGDCSGCTLSSACKGKSLVHHVEELPPVDPKDVAKPQPAPSDVKHTANAKNTEDVEKSGSDSSYADDDDEVGKEENK